MGLRTILPFALLGFIVVSLCPPSASAQLPRRLERCLPYPTLAQEISDMKAEIEAKMQMAANEGPQETGEPDAPERMVVIDEVRFEPPPHLPESTQAEIVAELKVPEFPAGSRWLEEFEEVGIRGAFQDRGYFKVEAKAEVHPISSDATRDHVSVTIHIQEGPQYRLGKLRFRTDDPEETLAFPADELRKQIPLRPGDIFDASKIREALEALRKLYEAEGYIDFVPEPQIEIDETNQRINLTMVLWQQKQYRVGKVEVLGPDPQTEALLKSQIKPGEVYSNGRIQQILTANKSALPDDVSPQDIELYKHVREGTVDLRFNFLTCPQIPD
jgi:outer membrane translocation and assembly module TamA